MPILGQIRKDITMHNFFETNAKHLNYERDGSHYITRTRLGDMEEIDKKLEEEMRVLKEYSKEESDYGDV